MGNINVESIMKKHKKKHKKLCKIVVDFLKFLCYTNPSRQQIVLKVQTISKFDKQF